MAQRTPIATLLLALLLAACGDAPRPAGGAPAAPAAPPEWVAEVAWKGSTTLGGCAVGDVDPNRPGQEVLVVGADGSVHVVFRDGDGWAFDEVGRAPGELIQCTCGSGARGFADDACIAVGMAEGREDSGGKGAAYAVRRARAGWTLEAILPGGFPALVHGAAVADVDPESPGKEVVLVGFDQQATIVTREDTGWLLLGQVPLPSPGKNAIPYVGGVAVACAGGTVEWITRGVEGYASRSVAIEGGAGAARLASDGRRLLVACDDGRLRLLVPRAEAPGTFDQQVLHEEPKKLRGAVLADLDPTVEGLEAATVGYAGRVTVLRDRGALPWDAEMVRDDGEALHHLAAGDLVPLSPGPELAACGFSGRLLVIRRR